MGRQSNAEEKRDRIIWALYDCLVKKGHEKATIKEIANMAGMPPGVIHYYFKNKDEIVSSLAEAIIEKYSTDIQDRIKEPLSTGQMIEGIVDFIVDRLIFNLPLNRVFYNLIQMAFEREELNFVVKHMLKDYREQITKAFKTAGPGKNSPMLGAALVAVTEGFSLQYMVDQNAFKKEYVKKMIAKTIENHLGTG